MDKKKLKDIMKIVAVLAVGTILSKTFFPPERKRWLHWFRQKQCLR